MNATAPSPLPDHRCLYILIAGLIVGMAFSPIGLGRFAPEMHANLFPALTEAVSERVKFEQGQALTEAMISRQLEALVGPDGENLDEMAMDGIETFRNDPRVANRGVMLRQRLARAQQHVGLMLMLVTAVIGVMIVETLTTPPEADAPVASSTRAPDDDASAGGDPTPAAASAPSSAGDVQGFAKLRRGLIWTRYVMMASILALLAAQPTVLLAIFR